jgi:predicted RNase H-like HicB family nuclease
MAKKPAKYIVTDGELVLVLERDEEDPKWFLVTSPFNPEILTQARTLDEAFEMARDVIQTYKDYRAKQTPAKAGKRSGKGVAKRTA